MAYDIHDGISLPEGTSFVIDLDLGTGENPDLGTDVCALTQKDFNDFGEDAEKPSSYTLTLGDELTAEVNSSQGDKLEVGAVQPGDDGDGSYSILVTGDSDPSKLDNIYFSGDVDSGESFTIDGDFGSQTFVHIYSSDGGSLLQTISFHTSCSAPLVIGDQYGSISLAGAVLEGKDTGTLYAVGATETDGDAGVIYEITGGNDADDFDVDPDTGEVTFKNSPDYENPTDSDGDNKYDVEVTAFQVDANGVKTGEISDVKTLEVCVEDDCIKVLENTSPVIADLDCGEGETDLGKEICAERDKLRDEGIDVGKLNQLTLTLNDDLTSVINSAQEGTKLEVNTFYLGNPDGGGLFIRVSDSDNPGDTGTVYFEGDVDFGESLTAMASAAGEDEFGSETYVHIFSSDSGQLLQTIKYHTSCSAPVTIGDQIGLVSLEGVGLLNNDTSETIEFGASTVPGDAGVVYEITGGNDADDFMVDPDTGEVTFKNSPDYENPTDSDGDNKYDVEVTAFYVDDNGAKTAEICEVKPLEVCVEDELEFGSISGRYFFDDGLDFMKDCDGLDNDFENVRPETAVVGATVSLIDANGVVIATTTSDENGEYKFTGLEPGTYSVRFAPTEGKVFTDQDVGPDDTIDSDVDSFTGETGVIVVGDGENVMDVDAGVCPLGSISGRYFCDINGNDQEDLGEPGVVGKLVTLFASDAETVLATTTTDSIGGYTFDQLETGDYFVSFEDSFSEGKHFVTPNVGNDDDVDSDVVNQVSGWTTLLTVRGGEEMDNIDAGVREVKVQFAKDISNIVVYLDCDGDQGDDVTKVKFDDFQSGLDTFEFSQIEDALAATGFDECEILAVTVKAGNNKGGFGPGEGEFIDIDLGDALDTGTNDKADLELDAADFFLFV